MTEGLHNITILFFNRKVVSQAFHFDLKLGIFKISSINIMNIYTNCFMNFSNPDHQHVFANIIETILKIPAEAFIYIYRL